MLRSYVLRSVTWYAFGRGNCGFLRRTKCRRVASDNAQIISGLARRMQGAPAFLNGILRDESATVSACRPRLDLGQCRVVRIPAKAQLPRARLRDRTAPRRISDANDNVLYRLVKTRTGVVRLAYPDCAWTVGRFSIICFYGPALNRKKT